MGDVGSILGAAIVDPVVNVRGRDVDTALPTALLAVLLQLLELCIYGGVHAAVDPLTALG